MESKIYSNKELIGTSELQLTDESMGVVSGKFFPNENYNVIRKEIWNFHKSKSNNKFKDLKKLRINCQLESDIFLCPLGGFLITDIEELPNEDIEFQAFGNYRHVIEDNFLTNSHTQRILKPWESISIEQKISYEDELFKEIGKVSNKSFLDFLKPRKHKLSKYEFNAIAKFSSNDDVLFAVNAKGENKYEYAVIHLTWKGKLEKDDNYPKVEFFNNFNHFMGSRLYIDKSNWGE